MSRSRRMLFFIGILIIVILSLIGSYFAIVTLAKLGNDTLSNTASNSAITYTFDIQSKEHNGKTYGSCKVSRSSNLQSGHSEEINFIFDNSVGKFIPSVVIKNAQGENVTNLYQLTLTKKYDEVENINLHIQPKESVEYAGVFADAYKNTPSLKQGFYLLGDCLLQAEMDVSTFDYKTRLATFNVNVVNSNNESLDFFVLDYPSYVTTVRNRVVKIEVFYNEYIGKSTYEIIEGSLVLGHEIAIKYYGYEGYCNVKVLDEAGNEITNLYEIIITKYN